MVLITQRLKRGPVDSRVGMFPEPLNAYQNFQFEGALGQRLQKLGLLIGIGLLCITRFGPLNISEEKLQIQRESNILHP